MNVFRTINVSLWVLASFSATFVYSQTQESRKLSSSKVGPFTVFYNPLDPYLLITHDKEPERALFRTLHSTPFITIGYATESSPPIVDGNYKINEWTLFETPYQSINAIQRLSDHDFVIQGDIWGVVTKATYRLHFYQPRDEEGMFLVNQLAYNLSVDITLGTFNRVFLNYWCDPKESFHGFGVQVS